MNVRARMDKAVQDGRASALELAMLDFALRHGASPVVAVALAACQRATVDGHSCLDLNVQLPSIEGETPLCSAQALQDELQDSALVGSPQDSAKPLILDQDKLYLQRYWSYETALAECLRRLLAQVPQPVAIHQLQAAGLQATKPTNVTNWQAMAAFVAMRHHFTVISGGPGTGKTHTILRLLAALIDQAISQHAAAPLIRLAAPTGKAAARMLEAIKTGLDDLPATDAVKAHIPTEAQTLHRLLGLGFRSTAARHDQANPLAADLVIVDEASMVDLPMMAKLLDALAPNTRLILLGDRYQLASVEAGSVLAELCQAAGLNRFSSAQTDAATDLLHAPAADATCALSDHVVTLQTSRRFSSASGIGRLALLINQGDAPQALELLRSDPHTRLQPLPHATALNTLVEQLAEHFSALAHMQDPLPALQYLLQHAVLCAVRQGRFGSQGINQAITQKLALMLGFDPRQNWFHGRPVIINRNDYQAGLYNGDTGVCLRDRHGQLRVWFDTEQGLRSYLPSALPAHDSVFAMTVHKSQGSEYQRISLLLPDKDNRVLSRELIYTAITRASQQLCIHGSDEVLAAGIQRRIRRFSGLADRLST